MAGTSRRGAMGVFVVGAAAGAAVAALVTSGALAGAGASPPPPPGSSPVNDLLPRFTNVADQLPAFAGCEQLRKWYVATALPKVGPYGFGNPYVFLDSMHRVPAAIAGNASKAVGSSATGTNVQEAGVDEPDIAKTVGNLVLRVQGRHVVVTDVSGPSPHELSRVALPHRIYDAELLVDGSQVLVLGHQGLDRPIPYGVGVNPGGPMIRGPLPPYTPADGATYLLSIDISDPAHPSLTTTQRIDGDLVSARSYADGTVRVVLATGYPPLDFVFPNRDRTAAQATKANRRIVRHATIHQWLPQIRTGGTTAAPRTGKAAPLLACTDVRHPKVRAGFGTLSVLSLRHGDLADRTATAVTTAGDLVYSSAHRLYVATNAGGGWRPLGLRSKLRAQHSWLPRTQVHAFALHGARTTYVASGTVPGTVKDRWSFDEYDGHLRVATALGRGWQPRENAIFVLKQSHGRLRQVGRVDGMGRHEQIKAVRWFGDLAVVVAFHQVDPLYTVDLGDPARPHVVGKLRMPGFSSYLHPIGGGRLLGLGQSGSSEAGARVTSYDLRDLRSVGQTGTLALGAHTTTVPDWEPRAFTYLPTQHLALLPVTDERTGRSHLEAVSVRRDGSLSSVGTWPLRRWASTSVRSLPLDRSRVAIVGHGVRIIHLG